MKKQLFTLLGLCMISAIYAQDIIIKKNGEEIKTKVDEIGATDIKYKKFENATGPSYTIPKSEVFIIKYENGTKDIFNEIINTPAEKTEKTTVNIKSEKNTFSKFYIKAGGGYGKSISPGYYSGGYERTINSNTDSYKRKNISYGNGFNFGATFGFLFNKYLGSEINVSYLYGDKFTMTDRYTDHSAYDSFIWDNYGVMKFVNTESYTFYGDMLFLKPSLTINAGFEKINPYVSVGFVYGTGKCTEEYDRHYFDNNGNLGDVYNFKAEKTGGNTLGFSSSFGVSFKFGNLFSIFSELNIVNANYIPKESHITKYIKNGIDGLGDLHKNQIETQFVDSYSIDANNPPKDYESSSALKQSLNFDSFGINVGIKISFWYQTANKKVKMNF